MGPKLRHTLVSFDFADQAPLTFSIEIRKEKHEDFSAIGGFFRQYELSLVAADEKDIIYTRSNIRGCTKFIFSRSSSIHKHKHCLRCHKADALAAKARWYNTLTSNCTTLLFDMIQAVSQKRFPADIVCLLRVIYQIIYMICIAGSSLGYANFDYQRAHINPHVKT